MSTNVTALEVFCLAQVERIKGTNRKLTYGVSGRIKRNRSLSERIGSKEWARFTYNMYRKMSGTK